VPSVVVPSVHVNVQPVPPCTDAVSVSTPLQLVLPLTAMLAVSALTVSVTESLFAHPPASVTVPVITVVDEIGPTVKSWH